MWKKSKGKGRNEKLKQSRELRREDGEGEREDEREEKDVEDERDLPMVFASAPPTTYICPIHNGVLFDPVIASRCGHTFCRYAYN